VIVLLLAVVIAGVGAFSLMMMPSSDEDDEDERLDDVELGHDALDLDDLDDVLSGFDGYAYLEDMEGDDLADLAAIAAIFGQNKRQRAIKYMYERIDWSRHVEKLDAINELENRFRMPLEHFEILCDALRECITVDFLRSRNSTGGNDPIYPEVILAIGLRFVGLGDTIAALMDICTERGNASSFHHQHRSSSCQIGYSRHSMMSITFGNGYFFFGRQRQPGGGGVFCWRPGSIFRCNAAGSCLECGSGRRPLILHHSTAENPLLAPCDCTGTMAFVHYLCIEQWRCRSRHPNARNGLNCETCGAEYTPMKTRRQAVASHGRKVGTTEVSIRLLSCIATAAQNTTIK